MAELTTGSPSQSYIDNVTIEFTPAVYYNLIAMVIVYAAYIIAICHYYKSEQQTDTNKPMPLQTVPSVSQISMVLSKQNSDNSENEPFERERINSISGPAKGSAHYSAFVVTLSVMIISGSCNDFLGKLIYQMFPGNNHDLHGIAALKAEYWITFLLTSGSFAVCSMAIFTRTAQASYHKLNKKLFLKIFVPSVMDFFVTGGRYLGLVFLSGAVVSIMKNGTQLLFLALLRRCLHRKILKWSQAFGIMIVVIGLCLVAFESIAITSDTSEEKDKSSLTLKDSIIGITIMLTVGLFGAFRNDIEEILLKNDNLDSNFVVGMESIISLLVTAIMGIILFVIDPFHNIGDKSSVLHSVYNVFVVAPALIFCFGLFLIAIYGKDTMQMKMTSLSSSLTRKLFQQIYPSGTWIISLIAWGISTKWLDTQYGEGWEGKYSGIRLGGFVIVLIGNYFYIKGIPFFKVLSSWVASR